ncbi:FAD:protein FMN transferase [Catellatospora chokoriensis]|uniref:FAD:protein FMN transferase n=1 Tax=Catellatospora chokoriensis TaxID=310353 RepID=A0A8J3KBP6_9ACTN|nr:FAD:protein FMN transferase [Catellatospora chokoriensis]GIF93034.1 FAD:protein FMN transferase [Catellatospora chokoriensis]
MSAAAPRRGLRRVEQVMGTAVSLQLADDRPETHLRELADDVFTWLRTVDERFSTYKPASEVNRLQRGDLSPTDASTDMRHVLATCERLREATSGYFDAYATGRLDPSGYVKGWSVQVAADLLAAAGTANFCLNAGGDICVRGHAAPGRPWRIGIRHPEHADKLCEILSVTDTAIATSGTYERGGHVIDPYTGRAAADLVSVTVLGPDLATADAYATAALAMGSRGISWLAEDTGYAYNIVTATGHVHRSHDLPAAQRFEPDTR